MIEVNVRLFTPPRPIGRNFAPERPMMRALSVNQEPKGQSLFGPFTGA
ncbi:hypothetical protein [Aureimonas mangrovi]|nr:hypothetical protein [Aureimonas mangrovi]